MKNYLSNRRSKRSKRPKPIAPEIRVLAKRYGLTPSHVLENDIKQLARMYGLTLRQAFEYNKDLPRDKIFVMGEE